MATETKTFYPGAYEDATGLYRAIKDPNNPVGKGSNNTTYARFGARNKTAIVYWPFDVSAIPVDATIESVACKAKSKGPTYEGTSGAMQLYSGTTPKGSSVSSPTFAGTKDITAGAWTRSELNDIRLRTSVKSPSSSAEYFDFYGADLTVTYTYNSEKFMLKLGGDYKDISRTFKRVKGIWAEQTELANVIEDGVRYQNGGEIESTAPKAIPVTITGKGNAKFCFATINGTKYISAASGIEVMPGYTVRFTVRGDSSTTYVVINGTKVHTGTADIETSYDWTIPDGVSSISIELYDDGINTAQITVTTA